jgi:phage/conjugal plasmid C-4 type zinc finger TraR family protein
MTDIVDDANRQAQRELDQVLKGVYTAPANSIYDCIDCDSAIGIARKSAVPWATRCIKCQSAHEAQRGQR